jgi:hypothetical protein
MLGVSHDGGIGRATSKCIWQSSSARGKLMVMLFWTGLDHTVTTPEGEVASSVKAV